jgi:hypothetical protein
VKGVVARVQVSRDAGASWQALPAPASAVLTLDAFGNQVVSIAAVAPGSGGVSCPVGRYVLAGNRQTWKGPSAAAVAWYLEPDDATKVHTPSGDVLNPCRNRSVPVRGLVGFGPDDAALLCTDGEVFRTRDGGNQWARMAVVPRAAAIAWQSRALGWLVVQPKSGCRWAVQRTIDGGSNWQRPACLSGGSGEPFAATPAIAFDGPTNGMVVASGATYRSTDGGLTWQAVRR